MHRQRDKNTVNVKPTLKGLQLSGLARRLVNDFQRGFPLSPTPFADIADQIGVDEGAVLSALRMMQQSGIMTRVGAVFRPNHVGVSTLATMAVPAERLEAVADIINTYLEVNHNYEREHSFNLWFVVTASDQDHLYGVLADIEQRTGLPVLALPLIEDYHIDLAFPIQWTGQSDATERGGAG